MKEDAVETDLSEDDDVAVTVRVVTVELLTVVMKVDYE